MTRLRAVALCRELGLTATGCFMIGLPGETRGDIEDTISSARELSLDVTLIAPLVLLPGSLLYEQAVKEGRILKDAWKDCLRNPRVSLPRYLPLRMSEREIDRLTRKAYRKIYLRPAAIAAMIRRAFAPGGIRLYSRMVVELVRFLFSSNEWA